MASGSLGPARHRGGRAESYGAHTPRAIVLGCVLVVAAAWGMATLLNLLGATLEAIRWLVPAVCVPIVLWLMSRAVRTDAYRFFRDDAPPQTWAEGGNTLLDEAIGLRSGANDGQ